MKVSKICFYIFLVLTIAVDAWIIVESCFDSDLSGYQSTNFSYYFVEFIKLFDPNTPLAKDPELTHYVIRKLIGHFAFFGLSGVVTAFTFVFSEDNLKNRKIQSIIALTIFGYSLALLSELIQLFIPGRYFAFTDTLIDFSGFVLGAGVIYLVSWLIYRHKSKKIVN